MIRSHPLIAIVVLTCACSSEPATSVVIAPEDAGPTDTGLVDVYDGGGDVPEEARQDVADAGRDGPELSVRVALVPTTEEVPDGGTSGSARAEAVLTALAAGVRGLVWEMDWAAWDDEVDGGGQALEELASVAAFLEEQRARLLLAVPVVHALADSRPTALQGRPWDDSHTRKAMHALVDDVFDRFGTELGYVSFGIEVGRYLSAHPAEASSFESFMVDTLQYARNHPSRPADVSVGVTWSTDIWSASPAPAEVATLTEASDVVMLCYYGLDDSGGAKPPLDAVADLSDVAGSANAKPVVLHRVAFTSSSLVGGSEESQATFVAGMLRVVLDNRARVPFVGVMALHDPLPEDCLRFAQTHDLSISPELYAFWCSTGLRDREGHPKDGFASFVAGSSALLNP